ncbi:hypothetical protein [Fodinibacter luteus]
MSRMRTLVAAAILAAMAVIAPSVAAAGPPSFGDAVASVETWTWKG